MKQHRSHIEEEVAKTLSLLDKPTSIEVTTFFRARLMERVTLEGNSSLHGNHAFHVDYRVAFMALLLFVNLASSLLLFKQENGTTNGSTKNVAATLSIDTLAEQELIGGNDQNEWYEIIEP